MENKSNTPNTENSNNTNFNENKKITARDKYNTVVENFIKKLENNDTVPWTKSWDMITTLPKNFETKNLDHLIGKTGIAETDHHPEGLIRIGDNSYDSYCDSGFLSKGTELQIIRIESFRLIVEPR